MTKYLADAKKIEIRPLEVLRETEQTVWVSEPRIDPKPIRMAKRSYEYNQAICDDQKTAAQFIVHQIEVEDALFLKAALPALPKIEGRG